MIYLHKLYIGCAIGLSSIPVGIVFIFTHPNQIIYLSVPLVLSFISLGIILIPLVLPEDKQHAKGKINE